MPAAQPTYPITEPFGTSAGGSFITLPIPVPSQIGTDAGAASFTDGFPPATMTEEVAGGVPPYGQDMNGILYMLSAAAGFLGGGNLYQFDSTRGGYAQGAVLSALDGTNLWISTTDSNAVDPDTVGTNWNSLGGYGFAVLNLTSTSHILTPPERAKPILVLRGALTANVQIVFPDNGSGNAAGQWIVANQCTGAFTVKATTVSGTDKVTIPVGGLASPTPIYSTGGGIYPATAPLAVPIDVAATPSTLAERDTSGRINATQFNQATAVEVPSIGAVFVQNTAADGYLRKITAANFIAQLGLAKTASPGFSGTPTAPTAAPGTNTIQLATTAFVAALGALKANAANAALTGVPTAPTAVVGTSNTQLATTAFVNANSGILSAGANGSFQIGQFQVVWGLHTSGSTGAEAVAFSNNFPTACVGVFCQSSGAQHTTNATSVTTAGFNLTAGVSGQPTYWFAIGY